MVRFKGKLFGYLNRCRHVALPLDWGDNDFFSRDKKFLICKNHGAVYAPDSGICLSGPCSDAGLIKIPVTVEKNKLYLELQDGLFADFDD